MRARRRRPPSRVLSCLSALSSSSYSTHESYRGALAYATEYRKSPYKRASGTGYDVDGAVGQKYDPGRCSERGGRALEQARRPRCEAAQAVEKERDGHELPGTAHREHLEAGRREQQPDTAGAVVAHVLRHLERDPACTGDACEKRADVRRHEEEPAIGTETRAHLGEERQRRTHVLEHVEHDDGVEARPGRQCGDRPDA